MAYDIFLKIDGIDGESMDDKHKNEIEVLSWRWNIHQSPPCTRVAVWDPVKSP